MSTRPPLRNPNTRHFSIPFASTRTLGLFKSSLTRQFRGLKNPILNFLPCSKNALPARSRHPASFTTRPLPNHERRKINVPHRSQQGDPYSLCSYSIKADQCICLLDPSVPLIHHYHNQAPCRFTDHLSPPTPNTLHDTPTTKQESMVHFRLCSLYYTSTRRRSKVGQLQEPQLYSAHLDNAL